MSKSKRTKACDILMSVKKKVWERDNFCCVICGRSGYGVMPNSHYISRQNGGLGIEQNIVTMCMQCHRDYDFSTKRNEVKEVVKSYLQSKYEHWNEKDLTYKKYDWEV